MSDIKQANIEPDEQQKRLAEVLYDVMDAIDKLMAHAGDEDARDWWYELRNDVKPTLDWARRYGVWR